MAMRAVSDSPDPGSPHVSFINPAAPTRRTWLIGASAAVPVALAAPAAVACEGLPALQVALRGDPLRPLWGVSNTDTLVGDPLLELERRYVAAADASNAAHARYSDAEDGRADPAEVARLRRESDRLLAEYLELADAMTDAVPASPAGVAVKARRLLESLRMGDDGSEEGNILSILAWAGAATGEPQDGPIILGAEAQE